MNRYLLPTVLFLLALLIFTSSTTKSDEVKYQYQKVLEVGDSSVYEFNLSDGTHCIIANASGGEGGVAITCAWEKFQHVAKKDKT